MDTLKDKQWLESLHESGQAPWQVWDPDRTERRPRVRRLRMMLPLELGRPGASPARVLAIGAHPDDIEIGCGGTILKLIEQGAVAEVRWVVLSGEGERAEEARAAPRRCSTASPESRVVVCDFRDGFFPYEGKRDQGLLRGPEARVLAGRGLHPSARRPAPGPPAACELTWNTFRDHLILEYEVPKYDGDMSAPNAFVPLSRRSARRKIDHLMDALRHRSARSAGSRRTCSRGCCGCAAWSATRRARYAEAFFCRKAVLGVTTTLASRRPRPASDRRLRADASGCSRSAAA